MGAIMPRALYTQRDMLQITQEGIQEAFCGQGIWDPDEADQDGRRSL